MAVPRFINQPVTVEARLRPDNTLEPAAFVWRDRRVTVSDWGREWREEAGGTEWCCYLVRDARGETYELRHAESEGRWQLTRAWLATEG